MKYKLPTKFIGSLVCAMLFGQCVQAQISLPTIKRPTKIRIDQSASINFDQLNTLPRTPYEIADAALNAKLECRKNNLPLRQIRVIGGYYDGDKVTLRGCFGKNIKRNMDVKLKFYQWKADYNAQPVYTPDKTHYQTPSYKRISWSPTRVVFEVDLPNSDFPVLEFKIIARPLNASVRSSRTQTVSPFQCIVGESLRDTQRLKPDRSPDGCLAPDKDNDGAGDAIFLGYGRDCDDANPSRFGGNLEVADTNGLDEDCDLTTIGHKDLDNDGFTDDRVCNIEGKHRICGRDCNDKSATIHIGQIDIFNGRDDNCNTLIDEDQSAQDIRRLLNLK